VVVVVVLEPQAAAVLEDLELVLDYPLHPVLLIRLLWVVVVQVAI
jgi:hypothetical protein